MYDNSICNWTIVENFTSQIYKDTTTIFNEPSITVDIDDAKTLFVNVDINVMESDLHSNDDVIDINDETIEYFKPRIETFKTYSFDGRKNQNNELNGWILYSVKLTSLN